MKIFKRILAMALVTIMSLTVLAGCGKKETIFIGSKTDLTGLRIGVQEGTTGDDLATDTIEDAKISRFKKAVDAAIDLKNGKLEAVILDMEPAKRIVAENSDLMILSEELSKEEYAIAVKKGNTELLESINATLKRVKEEGTYDEFKTAFFPKEGEDIAIPNTEKSTGNQTIVMGTNAEFPPFEYRANNQIVGFDVELANEIAKDLGKSLKVEDMAFDSLLTALSTGKVDMVVAGMSITDERLESVDFSDPYFDASQVIIIRKASLKD